MDIITMKEFLLRQPGFPKESETDKFYLKCANALLSAIGNTGYGRGLHPSLLKKVALTLVDYLQDVSSDAGVWRSFVEANRELYGWSVPFHPLGETYVDYELNREDVRFLVWYCIAMLWEEKRFIYPHNPGILELADTAFDYLESIYEDAPVPEEFNISYGLEFKDPEDQEKIYHLGHWLFLHSYLLTPAFSLTMSEISGQVDPSDKDFALKFNNLLEEAMMQNTTGPLALYTPEWVYLIIEGKIPEDKPASDAPVHPYYEKFTAATGGKDIMFFGSYDEMNDFFINALGWESGKRHLEMASGSRDFVLMVNRTKGMLMARDINRCIKSPDNPYYDKEYAGKHAFELLSERGCCPGDLLHRILKNGWLPDAVFPGSDDRKLVQENADFIARCYLQLYYRGD